MKTKTFKLITLLALCIIGFTSCSSDDDNTPLPFPLPVVVDLPTETVNNLHAPQTGGQGQGGISGEFTKFSFATGQTTTSDTDWDIAFRGTTIIVNGGESFGTTDEPARNGNAAAYIVSDSSFDAVTMANTDSFTQDSTSGLAIATGSGNGWYTYTGPPNHLIIPTPGKILVFKTHDGKYAKVEILSYYRNSDSSNPANGRYYSFNYVYQPNGALTTF